MASISDRVYDNGLSVLDTEANAIYICSAEPTTYAAATAANNGTTQFGLGSATGGAFTGIGAPAAGSPNGRQVTVSAITAGSVTSTGTATHFAIVDTANSRLLVTGALTSSQAVTSGNSFTLSSFTVRIPAAA